MKNIFKNLLFGCLIIPSFHITQKAEALVTHNLNYTFKAGDNTTSLSGTISFDETNVSTGENIFQTVGGQLQLPAFITNLSLVYFDGSTNTNFSASDFQILTWQPKAGITVDYSEGTDLVAQFDNINFLGRTAADPSRGGAFILNVEDNEYTLTSTPFPAGISVLPIAFLFNKRLKKLKMNKS